MHPRHLRTNLLHLQAPTTDLIGHLRTKLLHIKAHTADLIGQTRMHPRHLRTNLLHLQANPMDLIPQIAAPVVLLKLLPEFGFRHCYVPFPIGALLKALPSIVASKYKGTPRGKPAQRAFC